ncbi:MSHA biogenesis protein MshP [Paraglaciecola arctica]|uniref:MSHA biogenesis protein MshP n=1 Tax=Paraglaciecola arctica TaxID=1128911 RepID=UPI001C0732B1|nr:MSHA biogenesis protein MshP [Paraglaciecola arctica]MBU3005060.1 MSHA biogenesis protein MshP [Paraglaciecola arctica]
MYRKKHQPFSLASLSNQKGSMLVIALFVIIVLALLGLTITRLLSSSSDSIIHEVLGQRALNAARAGIECAVAQEFGGGCNHPVSKEFNAVAGLENCNYSVTPTSKSIEDGAKTFTFWTFSSTGQCSAGKINVTRFVYIDAMLESE